MKKTVILILCSLILAANMVVISGCDKDEEDMKMTVEDIDGNIYNAAKIGTQVWMSSNLRTTKYNDGSGIPNETSNAFWDNGSTPAYCWYDNDEASNVKYGALYNLYAVDTKKLCPEGWHVPGETDWTTLEDYLGGAEIAGGKLKEPGKDNWISANYTGNDDFGFTALPGGYRSEDGSFRYIGEAVGWWSSDKKDASTAGVRVIWHDTVALYNNFLVFSTGQHIRCIQD